MGTFVKLHSEILDSTIWQEAHHVRILWITMLAMKDKNGEVMASIPGLAHRARITPQECEEGLTILISTDRYSRTKDHDGRRIDEVEGGWKVLNHEKYRGPTAAERTKKWREGKGNDDTFPAVDMAIKALSNESEKHVTPCDVTVTSRDTCDGHERHTYTDTDLKSKNKSAKNRTNYSPEFENFWKLWPGDPKGSKKKAFTIWQKTKDIRPEYDRLAYMVQAEEIRRQRSKQQGKFVAPWKHLERWLTWNCWMMWGMIP